jgi:hypothetical protein
MNSLRQIDFFTLAGVSSAQLEGDRVIGLIKEPLPEFHCSQNSFLSAEFANYPRNPEGVLRFTRQYGILEAPPSSDERFSFQIDDWRKKQNLIRHDWEVSLYFSGKWGLAQHGELKQQSLRVERGEEWILREGKLEYKVSSLFRLIHLEFVSIPLARVRKCKHAGCKNPYFVARHLGQQYCSEVCARWAQREWKKEWWEKNGARWRNKRIKTKKCDLEGR